MSTQLNIFQGQLLRDAGIQMAVDHANSKTPGWEDVTYKLLQKYIQLHPGNFFAEEVRQWAEKQDVYTNPPKKQSWGHIMLKASKNNLIKRVGFGQVSNPKAHCTPASIWTAK